MNKNIAVAVMEQTSAPTRLKNVEKIKGVGSNDWYLRFHSTFQDFDTVNRNGRNYLNQAMIPALSHANIRELVSEGAWQGELGHPITKDMDRIVTIDPKLTCHRITSLDVTTAGASGISETLCTEQGINFRNMIAQGMTPAYSLRALAKIDRSTGTQVVQAARVICYDAVILPSHKAAYATKSRGYEAAPVLESVSESFTESGIYLGNGNSSEDFSCVLESQVISRMLKESDNLHDALGHFNIKKGHITMDKNLSKVIVRESTGAGNSIAVHVNIDDKIRRDLRSALIRL